MNVLIVYAHPNPRSFNNAILGTVDTTLRERRHTTRIKDLYRLGRKVILDAEDLGRIHQRDIPEDILREQADMAWAQGLVFIYPIWWFGPPAILKGWIDRVFVRGFAFDFTKEGMKGLLGHEKALVLTTLGGDEATYRRNDWQGIISRPLTDGTLSYCGVQDITHRAFYQVPSVGDESRRGMLEEVRTLTREVFR
ncbi:MAG: NAD(P)H-dependent oxidoreductase [Candidatus Competibacteraceae bacterium]|nr:NAD(P)H-dependent oxidoreductase [Candidatus Competibacteraceae bacterium]